MIFGRRDRGDGGAPASRYPVSARPQSASVTPGGATGVPTTDRSLHGTVTQTEVPGDADLGRVVRPPGVAVYRRDDA